MRASKAVTLVELLVVLAIVALLAAILLPAAKGLFTRYYVLACARNLRSIHSLLMAYAGECGGEFPAFHAYHGGSIFHPARYREDYQVTMRDVLVLKRLGAGAETMFCPMDPYYGYPSWRWRTWSTRQYTASLGYAAFINRRDEVGEGTVPARFADGRECPTNVHCDNDIPLMADNLRYRSDGQPFGWYHGRDGSKDPEDGFYRSSCNTLLRGGQVVFSKWSELEEQGPGLVMKPSARDAWWFHWK